MPTEFTEKVMPSECSAPVTAPVRAPVRAPCYGAVSVSLCLSWASRVVHRDGTGTVVHAAGSGGSRPVLWFPREETQCPNGCRNGCDDQLLIFWHMIHMVLRLQKHVFAYKNLVPPVWLPFKHSFCIKENKSKSFKMYFNHLQPTFFRVDTTWWRCPKVGNQKASGWSSFSESTAINWCIIPHFQKKKHIILLTIMWLLS